LNVDGILISDAYWAAAPPRRLQPSGVPHVSQSYRLPVRHPWGSVGIGCRLPVPDTLHFLNYQKKASKRGTCV